MIGVLAAIVEPTRFSRIVLVAPSPCYINEKDYIGGFTRQDIEGLLDLLDSNHIAWSSMLGPTIMGNADRPELAEELTASFCRTDPTIAPETVGQYVHQQLAGSRLVKLAATGHCPNLSAPAETSAAIREFLTGRPAA